MKKKKLSIVLIAISLILLLTACDGSISETLKNIMGPFHGKNVYVDAGLIKPSTVGLDMVKDASKTETTKGDDIEKDANGNVKINSETKGLGSVIASINEATGSTVEFTINDQELNKIVSTNGFLQPQNDAQKKKLNEGIAKVNESTSEVKLFSEEMAKPSSNSNAAKGTLAVAASVINEVTTKMNLNDTQKNALNEISKSLTAKAKSEGTLSQGEVLQAQMITNLVASSASAIKEIQNNNFDINNSKIKDFIDESISVINVSKTLAGGSILDVTTLLGSLLPMMNNSNKDNNNNEPTPQGSLVARSLSRDASGNSSTDNDDNKELKEFLRTGILKVPSALEDFGYKEDGSQASKEEAEESKKSTLASFTVIKDIIRSLYAVEKDGSFNRSLAYARLDANAYLFKYYQNLVAVLGLDNAEVNAELKNYVAGKFAKVETATLINAILGFTSTQLNDLSLLFLEDSNSLFDIIQRLVQSNKAYFAEKYSFKGGETIKVSTDDIKTLQDKGILPDDDGKYSPENGEENKNKMISYYAGEEDSANSTYKGTAAFHSAFSTFDGLLKAVGIETVIKDLGSIMGGDSSDVDKDFSFKKMYEDNLKDMYKSEHDNGSDGTTTV